LAKKKTRANLLVSVKPRKAMLDRRARLSVDMCVESTLVCS
jgi:hypothetical protein